MKNKKLGILGMVLFVAVLGEAQTEKPRIARAEKIRQEIAAADNELTEALFKPDKDALDRLWSDEFVFYEPRRQGLSMSTTAGGAQSWYSVSDRIEP